MLSLPEPGFGVFFMVPFALLVILPTDRKCMHQGADLARSVAHTVAARERRTGRSVTAFKRK